MLCTFQDLLDNDVKVVSDLDLEVSNCLLTCLGACSVLADLVSPVGVDCLIILGQVLSVCILVGRYEHIEHVLAGQELELAI